MKTKLIVMTLTVAVAIGIITTSANDASSDAATKQKLLGYWSSPRHEYLYKQDGIRYMVGGTTTNHWDVRGGVYYEGFKPYDIVSFSRETFVYRSREPSKPTFTLKRCSDADITKMREFYADWMKQHE